MIYSAVLSVASHLVESTIESMLIILCCHTQPPGVYLGYMTGSLMALSKVVDIQESLEMEDLMHM